MLCPTCSGSIRKLADLSKISKEILTIPQLPPPRATLMRDVTTVKKPLVDVPEFAAMAAGRFLDETIAPLLTPDQVIMMKEDCVLKEDRSLKTFADLGMEPSSMDKYAFDFLHRFRPGGHFTQVQGYH